MKVNFNTELRELKNTKKYFNLKNDLFAKIESSNIFGSIKDRFVYEALNDLIENKKITSDTILVEATSGNTGISLSGFCNKLGIKCLIVMPENVSKERFELIEKYNGVILKTPKEEQMIGSIKKIESLIQENPNIIWLDQFSNPLNIKAHLKTGAQILKQIKPDIFVASFGTGGTISGITSFLKNFDNSIYTAGLEPLRSPFVTKGIKGEHLILGIGSGFIPKNLKLDLIDEVIAIDDSLIYDTVKLISKIENLDVGLSSACNYLGLLQMSKKNISKKIVTVFPDSASRYTSILKK